MDFSAGVSVVLVLLLCALIRLFMSVRIVGTLLFYYYEAWGVELPARDIRSDDL